MSGSRISACPLRAQVDPRLRVRQLPVVRVGAALTASTGCVWAARSTCRCADCDRPWPLETVLTEPSPSWLATTAPLPYERRLPLRDGPDAEPGDSRPSAITRGDPRVVECGRRPGDGAGPAARGGQLRGRRAGAASICEPQSDQDRTSMPDEAPASGGRGPRSAQTLHPPQRVGAEGTVDGRHAVQVTVGLSRTSSCASRGTGRRSPTRVAEGVGVGVPGHDPWARG